MSLFGKILGAVAGVGSVIGVPGAGIVQNLAGGGGKGNKPGTIGNAKADFGTVSGESDFLKHSPPWRLKWANFQGFNTADEWLAASKAVRNPPVAKPDPVAKLIKTKKRRRRRRRRPLARPNRKPALPQIGKPLTRLQATVFNLPATVKKKKKKVVRKFVAPGLDNFNISSGRSDVERLIKKNRQQKKAQEANIQKVAVGVGVLGLGVTIFRAFS